MIKAIIFDFFGVVVTEGFNLFCDTYFPDDKVKRHSAKQLIHGHDAGYISKTQYISGLAELAGVSEEVVDNHMTSNKPNKPLLDYIKNKLKQQYKIGILSNSGDNYIGQILDSADMGLFDDVILSYRHGVVKPQMEIFKLAAERLGVLTTECVFIDDTARHYEGALAAGMKAILYQNFSQMKNELEEILKS